MFVENFPAVVDFKAFLERDILDIASDNMWARYKLRDIIGSASRKTGVPVHEIRGPSRSAKIVFARQMFCYYSRVFTLKSWAQIGNYINRDHTTVVYSARIFAERHDLPQVVCPEHDELKRHARQ